MTSLFDLPPHFASPHPIGEGAFGKVYRADTPEGPVAVKVLGAEAAERAEAAWLFAGEYRRLARLSHPGFPRAVEEGRTPGGSAYYAMEFVVGAALEAEAARPAVAVRKVVAGVAEALAYLHSLGLVHGDLKPDNLLMPAGAPLKVLDVGLMVPVGSKPEAIAGTLEYLAPEVFRKAPVAPPSDLYALGVLAYQLLTGRLPFTGSPSELIRAHMQAPPPPIGAYPGEADPALEALIARLLAKEPSARPASSLAVLAALGHEVSVELLDAAGAGLRGGVFVGREAAMAAWRDTLAPGAAGWLGLVGPFGSGKSRTLDECRLIAQLAGLSWVGANCAGATMGAPIRAVTRQALAAAGCPPSALLSAWLAGELPAEAADLEPAAARAMIHAAVGDALAAAATATGGLAIALDDADQADGASTDFLRFMRRRGGEAPLYWVLTFAELPADASLVPERLETLAPLGLDEATALVAARLGTALPEGLAEVLMGAAQGSPLMLDLALEHMVASQQLRATSRGWLFDAAAGAGTMPGSLAAFWLARLEALSPDALALAAAAAVAAPAGEIAAAFLAEVTGLDPTALRQATDALASGGLLTEREGQLRLIVAGSVPLLEERLSPERRAAIAAILARLVLGAWVDSPESAPFESLGQAARLALRGDDNDLAWRIGLEAGRRSLALAAPREALELLEGTERRMALAPLAARLDVAFLKADAKRLLDQAKDAVADYEAAAELASQAGVPGTEARIWNGLAKCRLLLGDYDGAFEALARAADRAQSAGDAAQQVRAAVTEGRLRLFKGEIDRSIALSEQAVAWARAAGAGVLLAQALNLQGVVLAQLDPPRAEEASTLHREALALSRALGDRIGTIFALDNLGNARLTVGDLGGAARAFSDSAAECREAGADTEALSANLNLAIVAGERGDLAQALRLSQEVAAKATAAGRKFPVAVVRSVDGQAAWRDGRLDDALAPFDEALALAQGLKNQLLEEHVRNYRLEALLALGDREGARAELEVLAPLVLSVGSGDMRARLVCHQAELARQLGLPADEGALALLASGEHQLAAHRASQILVELALDAARPGDADPHIERALAIAMAWDAPWHIAQNSCLKAHVAFALGDRSEAGRLAREVLSANTHPLARAGAALLLHELGETQLAAAELGQLASTLGPALEHLVDPAGFLAAWRLEGLVERLAAAQRPSDSLASGLTVDPGLFAHHMASLTLADGEVAIAQAVLAGATAMIGAERGYVLVYEGGRMTNVITQDMDYAREVATGFSSSIANQALFASEPIYVADAATDDTWSQSKSVMALGLRTVVAVPLATPVEMLGVLYLDREAIEPLLAPGDLTLLSALATTAAGAVFAARRERALAGEIDRQRACAELGARMAAPLNPEAKREALLAAMLAAAGAERAMWLFRSEGGEWIAQNQVGPPGGPKASQGIADWVAERGESIGILDTSAAEGFQERRSVQALGLRTVWCVPVPGRDDAVVYLDASEVVPTDPAPTLQLLEALVAYAST